MGDKNKKFPLNPDKIQRRVVSNEGEVRKSKKSETSQAPPKPPPPPSKPKK